MNKKCNKNVHQTGIWPVSHQCRRNAVKDGYCKQHHSDSVAERRKKSTQAWEKKQANNPLARIQELKKQLAEKEAALERVRGLPDSIRADVEMIRLGGGEIVPENVSIAKLLADHLEELADDLDAALQEQKQ